MLFVGLIVVGLVAVSFTWSLIDGIRTPHRYERLYDEVPWKRVITWIVVLTVAALLGGAIGGANADTLWAITAAGFVLFFSATRFAAAAAFNRALRDLFRR